MALISIAYGYKIHIMLFQKHRNTQEAFQKIMKRLYRTISKEARDKPNNEGASCSNSLKQNLTQSHIYIFKTLHVLTSDESTIFRF